jgi:hypothetical protein
LEEQNNVMFERADARRLDRALPTTWSIKSPEKFILILKNFGNRKKLGIWKNNLNTIGLHA